MLNTANVLTLSRIAAIPLVVACFWLDRGWSQWLSMALFVAAGITDFFDGQLARRLHQQTMLGQYLDPIADKMLMSTMFLVLSLLHRIPWKFTVVVFGRDISILLVSAVLYVTANLRDFRPSVFGKANAGILRNRHITVGIERLGTDDDGTEPHQRH